MLQFCPDPSEVSVPPEMSHIIPVIVIRRFISPRLLSALPLLCPEAEEDNEKLLAWIFSNSLIHDKALSDRLLSKICMNSAIKESSMRATGRLCPKIPRLEEANFPLHIQRGPFLILLHPRNISLLCLVSRFLLLQEWKNLIP
ncbi:hypothetical protein GEMRC1_001832 [Eukaryota sp. GEM-RC1]